MRLLLGARPGRAGMPAVATVLLLTAMLAGCGGADDDTAPAATATADQTIATSSEAGSGEETRVAQTGDNVRVHYHGTLDNGEVFDSSRDREPLTFQVGASQVIEGFDNAVVGLGVGESTKVRLEPEQAYGEHTDDLIFDVPSDQAPEGLSPGDQVRLQNGAIGTIEAVTAESVRIDANHPLAGEALTFEIELVAID